MEKIQTPEVYEEVLGYLKKHLEQCIYLTIDLETYGYANPDIQFWYTKKDNAYDTVFMKYYDSVQLFSANQDWDVEETVRMLKQFQVITICAKRDMIEKLEAYMEEYNVAYGIVVKDDVYRELKQFELVRPATVKDVEAIVELMYTDKDYSDNYTIEGLQQQLRDRILESKGRSFVIEEDGKIVAHTAVYAQCENIAIEGGLIVDEKYKKRMYGMIIHEYIKKVLLSEGKAVYGFRVMDNMQRYAKLGNLNIVGHYGKMSRKEK